MRRTRASFALEVTAFLVLCGIVATLMGVPGTWTLLALLVLIDFGIIFVLSYRPRPVGRCRVRVPAQNVPPEMRVKVYLN
jgi:hypothetical protein